MSDVLAVLAGRFWKKVVKSGGCWLWTAGLNPSGYGQFWDVRVRATRGAHRFSYELAAGAPPGDTCVCHRCDVRHCVRPSHLFLGTRAENTADARRKGRLGQTLTSSTVRQARSMSRSGVTQRDIAKTLGVTQTAVSQAVRGETWGHVPGALESRRSGSAHWNAKLSDGDVRLVRQRLASGERQRAVAADFGVSQTTISEIGRGVKWRSLT